MSAPIAIDEQVIRQRAHERWRERGCPTGSSEQDWLAAERELAAESLQSGRRSLVVSSAAATDTSSRSARSEDIGATRNVPRRAPRSIVVRSAGAPAAHLLVTLAARPNGSRTG
jgi:hypothetical protein